jgi:hypothetical protein
LAHTLERRLVSTLEPITSEKLVSNLGFSKLSLLCYNEDVTIAGVVLNKTKSEAHTKLITESIEAANMAGALRVDSP